MEEKKGFWLSLNEALSSGPTASSGMLTPRLFSVWDSVSNDNRETVVYNGDSVILSHDRGPGSYGVLIRICYKFGLGLVIPFSEAQASNVLSTAELHKQMAATQNSTPDPAPGFLSALPSEIRQIIYKFALRGVKWTIVDDEDFEHNDFPRGIGDPSGFYYPLSKASSVLHVNKQIRGEALPLAFRLITFCFDSLKRATMFLMAAGQIGRENIETLHSVWESSSEPTNNWAISSDLGLVQLPMWSICIQLLKQCKRLRHLSLQFDSDLIQKRGFESFKNNAGIQDLCTLQGLKRVDIQGSERDPLGHSSLAEPTSLEHLAEWLKKQMEERARTEGAAQ
ncbi:uncharacterized protein B0I36DRAFT_437046 [Microdochium trichocladiopsis]|uniref:Uncharacterized protein n=1 Tax=Microdochium trichocladiopsis TaxID=1682393 RepID=A0A9P8XSF1_9PEZI|nr:uncharacterized protein B0I36DRAFT_437046 [Microdochium trichocladiopsis]KAH7009219.1 hypothetical protein B0I36DRAFT_437046 [Microdochium trichocladiopsis]